MSEFDPAVFAENVRSIRLRYNLSIRDLAKLAGIDKQTLLRIEQGQVATLRTREKVAKALSTRVDRLFRRPSISGKGFVGHKTADDFWIETTSKRPASPADEAVRSEEIQSQIERLRLGSLGFVQTFTLPLLSAGVNGAFSAGLVELYDMPPAHPTPREMFLYCLRGPVMVKLGAESIILEANESVSIAPGIFGAFGATKLVLPNELPPLVLYVVDARSQPNPT